MAACGCRDDRSSLVHVFDVVGVCVTAQTASTDVRALLLQVQRRAAGGAALARRQQELLLRHRAKQPRYLHESQRGKPPPLPFGQAGRSHRLSVPRFGFCVILNCS